MAGAMLYGQLGEFNPDKEKITTYLDRVALYMEANSVAADKVAVLLTVIGPKNYALLHGLLAPTNPREKTFEELTAALREHYEPKPVVIAERFHFYRRTQAPGESIAEFLADLRKLAINCDFKAFLDEALRDRLVCGIKSEQTQKKLLTEQDLTLAKALQIAQAMEAAEARAKEMKGTDHSIHRVAGPCYRCGKPHDAKACRFREAKCHKCGKIGHIAVACRSKGKKPPGGRQQRQQNQRKPQSGREESRTKWLESTEDPPSVDRGQQDLSLFTVGEASGSRTLQVEVKVNGKPLVMEVDTGAAVSLLSEEAMKTHFPDAQLQPSTALLRTYTGEAMDILGELWVQVQYKQQGPKELSLVVVKGTGPCLFGRNWLRHIQLDWKSIATVSSHDAMGDVGVLLHKYSDVFCDELGTIKSHTAKLVIKEGSQPKFCRARQVPYATRASVEAELDRLERIGVLEKVDTSDWATPVVAVPKKNGRVRLCGDYKVTLNPAMDVDKYPLPRVEDMFATLAGGKHFTHLDLANAYQQLILDEDSRKFVTINTHRGLYRYKRLPFGVASAPAVFQRTMDTILQGLDGVVCYIDDVLVTGKTYDDHLRNLEKALQRMKEYGLRVRKEKCKFFSPSVEFLGYRIDAEGRHPLDSKLHAITEAPEPKNVTELRSFLGLLNYYGSFIPNLSSLLHPLNKLLQKEAPWKWTKECEVAFKEAKERLVSSQVLVHYDSNLPIVLAGDASAYGVGAVISHITPDGREHPIAFASRTLSSTEQNYPQVEKEALSLIYGVKKFHCYLYGRKFTLQTDHKPLTAIFGSKKGIPAMAAAWLQRWAVQLGAYDYEIKFRPTQDHCNADGLSRLPLNEGKFEGYYDEPGIFNLSQIDCLPVTEAHLKSCTATDRVLSKVLLFTKEGWPEKGDIDDTLQPYWRRKDEISIEAECLFWGTRAIIPEKLQSKLLQELHSDHPGITRMKALARSYMWWPGLDKAIETLSRSCQSCRAVKHAPAVAPLRPWTWPSKPWERVHVDFAGPFQGTMLFILVDAHSKWPEVYPMSSTTAGQTIDVLRQIFSAYGLPEQLVSDNGPQFISDEFATFVKRNGVCHIRCAPYHPASNGLAERFVQSVKQALKANASDGRSLTQRLCSFLLTYRTTPHATTGVTPCSLFLQRSVRTRLDLLKPNRRSHVLSKQSQQKSAHDRRAQDREWFIGQSVMVRNLRPGPDWVPGVIVERLGPLSYLIETDTHQYWKRHADQLKIVDESPLRESHSSTEFETAPDWECAESSTPETVPESAGTPVVVTPQEASREPPGPSSSVSSTTTTTVPVRKYPLRQNRRPPDRY